MSQIGMAAACRLRIGYIDPESVLIALDVERQGMADSLRHVGRLIQGKHHANGAGGQCKTTGQADTNGKQGDAK